MNFNGQNVGANHKGRTGYSSELSRTSLGRTTRSGGTERDASRRHSDPFDFGPVKINDRAIAQVIGSHKNDAGGVIGPFKTRAQVKCFNRGQLRLDRRWINGGIGGET